MGTPEHGLARPPLDDVPLVVDDDGATVVHLEGEHDASTAPALAAVLADLTSAGGAGDVVVSLADVTFIDAAIVGVLVGSARDLRPAGRRLRLRSPSPRVCRILTLCGVSPLLEIQL